MERKAQTFNMKRLLFIGLLFISMDAISQVDKYRVKLAFADTLTKNGGRNPVQKAWDYLVAFDANKKRFTIYKDKDEVYDIVKYHSVETNDMGFKVYSVDFVDNSGVRCAGKFIASKSNGIIQSFSIHYDKISYLYMLVPVD